MHGEQPAVRVILCHKQYKRIGFVIAAGRDGQCVALKRGRRLCAQSQRTAGEEYESVRIIRGELCAVILRAARKQHGVRSGDAAAGTDVDVAGLAGSSVARDDGRALNVHPAARFDINAAAEAEGCIAGDLAGFGAVGKHQRRTADNIVLIVAGADDVYGLVVQAQIERLILTENQLDVDVGLCTGKIADGRSSRRDG